MPADFATVEDRSFVISNFRLQDGTVMPQAKIAYETYGRLAAHGRNAVLITHGYTSSHHAAGRNPVNGNQPGWWDGLIESGKPIDTDRLFPPSIAPGVMRDLAAGGVDARCFEIDGRLGHSASGPEHAKWSPVLRQFLEPLTAKLG